MAQVVVLVGEQVMCDRCGWHWSPRKREVLECPHCHSAKWNVPLTQKERERRVAAGREVPPAK